MLIEFRSSDRMLGLKAVDIYRAGIEAAQKACDKVFVPTMELATADAAADQASNWLADNTTEMGEGETRDLDMPRDLAQSLRTACTTYILSLSKLTEKQADLMVPPDDTNEMMSRLVSLKDRLSGQLEMAGVSSVTFSAGNSEPVTLTGEQFKRAVDRLSTSR